MCRREPFTPKNDGGRIGKKGGKKEKRKRGEEGKNWRKEGSSNSQYAGMTLRLA